MEWNILQKIFADDCIYKIDLIGKGIYYPEQYEPTGREKKISDLLLEDRSGICYIAPSGAGKTSLFCQLVNQWSKEHAVFFTGLRFPLQTETSLYQNVCDYFKDKYQIDLRENIETFINLLDANKKKCIIVIDGLDEAEDLEEMKKALHFLLVHLIRGPIKLVMNCRNYVWKYIVNYTWLKSINVIQWYPDDNSSLFRGPSLDIVFKKHSNKYQITGTMNQRIRDLCQFPFSLRLFCEVNRRKSISNNDTLRYIDLYLNYLSLIANEVTLLFSQNAYEDVINVIESIALHYWEKGKYCILKNQMIDKITVTSGEAGCRIYKAFVQLQILREDARESEIFVSFNHQLILEFIIAHALFKNKMWNEKTNEIIANDINSLIKSNSDNPLLIPVFEFFFPLLETVGKHHVMIFLLSKKEKNIDLQLMLCRAAIRLGQMDLETWQMLRQFDTEADSEVKAEVASSVYLLGENIPGDQAFNCLMLIQCKESDILKRNIAARLKYDNNFSIFVKQIQPYCKIPDVQNGLVTFVQQIRNQIEPQMRIPLLNLTDLIILFNNNEGLENLILLSEYTKDDNSFLDAWVTVACNHADQLFIRLIKIYIGVVKNDRLKWDRIFRFCLAGGHKDPITTLKLSVQGFENLNNYNLMTSAIDFIGQYGVLEPESTCQLISLAMKKAKFLSSNKQMEIRFKTAEAALSCFKKNNRAFAKVITEIANGEDIKIKEFIASHLQILKNSMSS